MPVEGPAGTGGKSTAKWGDGGRGKTSSGERRQAACQRPFPQGKRRDGPAVVTGRSTPAGEQFQQKQIATQRTTQRFPRAIDRHVPLVEPFRVKLAGQRP